MLNHQVTKPYVGVGDIVPSILNLSKDGGEWPSSRAGPSIPAERAHVAHCTGGWVDPRAGPNDVVKLTAALARNRNAFLFDKSHLVSQFLYSESFRPCLYMQYVFTIYGRAKLTRILATVSQRRSGLNTRGE